MKGKKITTANIEKPSLEGLFDYKNIEPKDFTSIRRILGLSYIIVLVSLTSKVIADVYSMDSWFRPVVILTSIILPLVVWYIFQRRIKNKKPIYMIAGWYIWAFFVLQIGCLVIVWLWNWEAALISLLITVLLSSILFILIAVYRTAKQLMERTYGYKEPYLEGKENYWEDKENLLEDSKKSFGRSKKPFGRSKKPFGKPQKPIGRTPKTIGRTPKSIGRIQETI